MGGDGSEYGRFRSDPGQIGRAPIALSVATLGAGLAALVVLFIDSPSVADLGLWAAGTLLAVIVALIFIPHALAASIAVVVPLCLGIFVSSAFALVGLPTDGLALFAFGIALSLPILRAQIEPVLHDSARLRPGELYGVRPALAAAAVACLPPLLTAMTSRPGSSLHYALLAAGYAFVAFAVGGCLVLIVPILKFDEATIARINRLSEVRTRLAYGASMVAVPRWGMSVSGVGLVLAVLCLFGFQGARDSVELPVIAVLALAIPAIAAAISVTKGWREGVAMTLALVLLLLASALVSVGAVGVWRVSMLAAQLAVPALLAFVVADETRRGQALEDEPAIARLRAIENLGATIVFAALAAVAVMLPLTAHAAVVAVIASIPVGAAVALLFAPALATAVETLLPRRVSVEDLYTRR